MPYDYSQDSNRNLETVERTTALHQILRSEIAVKPELDVSAEFLPSYNPANRKIRLIFG